MNNVPFSSTMVVWKPQTDHFLCVLCSFVSLLPPLPAPGHFLPQNIPFLGPLSKLLCLPEEAQPSGGRMWEGVWKGSPHRKKDYPYKWRATRGQTKPKKEQIKLGGGLGATVRSSLFMSRSQGETMSASKTGFTSIAQS